MCPATNKGTAVSVLNMKGGVGKTTIAAHVMRVLYHRHRLRILLIDLDPQFNLTQCLIPRSQYEMLKKTNKTIFTAMEPPSQVSIFEVATTTKPPPNASELSFNLRYFTNRSAYLDLVAGNFELIKYSLVNDQSKLEKVQARFLRFVSQARSEYDLVVIDCNPSSSFMTLCALHACNHLLVPVRPDRYSILGLELVTDLLDRIPTIYPKPEISILLNGIPRQGYNTTIENNLRAHDTFGELVLTNKLPHSRLLEASPHYTGFATDKPVPYRNLLTIEIVRIVNELADRFGCI